jgi:hypothetical protein
MFSLLLSVFLLSSNSVLVLKEPKALTYAEEKLPHEGVLCQTKEGFLYVELPKEYVFDLLPLLSVKACPPPYFSKGKVGAHITVATVDEMRKVQKPVPLLGQKIAFSIEEVKEVSLKRSEIGEKAYILEVESPAVADLRKEMGLSLKPGGHELHITIGVDCPK